MEMSAPLYDENGTLLEENYFYSEDMGNLEEEEAVV